MKRILGLATAALMGASVLAAPAFAQNLETGGAANAEAVTEGVEQPLVEGATGVMPESVELSDKNYQTGGQHNAQAASEGNVSPEYTGSILPMDGQDRVYEEYETGGIYNAEEAKPN